MALSSAFSRCAEAVEIVARENRSPLVVMASHHDPKIEFENLKQLELYRVDGLILSSAPRRAIPGCMRS